MEHQFIEAWAKLSDGGVKCSDRLLVQLMMQMEAPLGLEAEKKVLEAVKEWKFINSEEDYTAENIENIELLVGNNIYY